ncbi:DUF1553 domain-containing protein [Roseiconus nitratireducens]|uniref:DUF1553 domain-containing protein n=1 Tax=Roseiconus nitratireducens TaxID=2605748 RepID=A0A5M6D2X0_9BACT|nr:DUF1553 domain-containing protein [Roseiconus nitratireducens]KAA5541844.1 DUF1553 domain-containing protein [Roseiconus nitratireducens]
MNTERVTDGLVFVASRFVQVRGGPARIRSAGAFLWHAAALTWVIAGGMSHGDAWGTDSVDSSANSGGPALAFDHRQEDLELRGRDARLQLIVSRSDTSGNVTDATREVTYTVDPDGIVEVSQEGFVTPLADGACTIVAESAEGTRVATSLVVADMTANPPLSFPGQIVPIFTKLSCNGGGCHGKAAGQNGFKLSLLGFEPREDYRHLIDESRGRRISPAIPDRSLLLLKATNASPHGGGQRLQVDSHEYRMLRRWIAQGMPYGNGDEPTVVSIEVFPPHRRLSPSSRQQLSVVATYSDGSREDVTRGAVYESNDPEMAEVNARGLVELQEFVGDVAVMARFQGQVAVFRADIPLTSTSTLAGEASQMEFPEPRNIVDELVFKKLASLRIPASPPCDDATYLRRVTLDIAGRLPTLQEAQAFASDGSPDKRARWVDHLLDSFDHAQYFANKWNAILKNRRQRGELHLSTMAFHDWIQQSIYSNQPYDQFVRDIITASGSVASNPPVAWYQQVNDVNQRVEDAAQLFLGQRIQCARCHHHPYEKWSRSDYAQMAAFFTTVTKKADGDPAEPDYVTRVAAAQLPDPKTGKPLPPAGLDAPPVTPRPGEDPRVQLADWMTDPSNPYFARAIANRYWKHFMGRGLIEPEDDLRVTNPPSNPELLDALADTLVKSGYDLKALIRMITVSKAYALDSQPMERNLGDRRSYSRFYPKRLQAEVLLDAVDQVTGTPTRFAGMPQNVRAVSLPDTEFDSYFLDVFGRPDSTTACECERSQDANLTQSLHLLNSEQMQNKLSDDGGRAAALAADPSRTDQQKVEELFQIALSREPADEEMKAMVSYLSRKEDSRKAYEDLIWSLINSKEFLFNH